MLDDIDDLPDERLKTLAKTCRVLMACDSLKRKGLLSGGPEIHRDGMQSIIDAAKRRGIDTQFSDEDIHGVLAAMETVDWGSL